MKYEALARELWELAHKYDSAGGGFSRPGSVALEEMRELIERRLARKARKA